MGQKREYRLGEGVTLGEIDYLASLPAIWNDPDEQAREVPFYQLMDEASEGCELAGQAVAMAVLAELVERGLDPAIVLSRMRNGETFERAAGAIRVREISPRAT